MLLSAAEPMLSSPGVGGDSVEGGDVAPSSCGMSPHTPLGGGNAASGGCVAFCFFADLVSRDVGGGGCLILAATAA